MHPKAKLFYDKRNLVFQELNMEYYRLLLKGSSEKVMADYAAVKEKLPSIDSYKNPQNLSAEDYLKYLLENKEYLQNMSAFLRIAKDSFNDCTPLIEKLNKEDLSSEDKFELCNRLASAKSCIDVLIN